MALSCWIITSIIMQRDLIFLSRACFGLCFPSGPKSWRRNKKISPKKIVWLDVQQSSMHSTFLKAAACRAEMLQSGKYKKDLEKRSGCPQGHRGHLPVFDIYRNMSYVVFRTVDNYVLQWNLWTSVPLLCQVPNSGFHVVSTAVGKCICPLK